MGGVLGSLRGAAAVLGLLDILCEVQQHEGMVWTGLMAAAAMRRTVAGLGFDAADACLSIPAACLCGDPL